MGKKHNATLRASPDLAAENARLKQTLAAIRDIATYRSKRLVSPNQEDECEDDADAKLHRILALTPQAKERGE